MDTKKLGNSFAVVLLGILVPVLLLLQAYAGISSLSTSVNSFDSAEKIIGMFAATDRRASTANDYAFVSHVYSESANQKTMINKQVMKVSIMQMGFAVISVGMMFIVLGIRDGGASGSAAMADLKFDFKSGSTGVVVFLVGATMATAGGVMRNDYSTVPVPQYILVTEDLPPEKSVDIYRQCRAQSVDLWSDCFIKRYEEVYAEVLK